MDPDGVLYIAGPMSGLPQLNFRAFHAAGADLRERGYAVVDPAELDELEGIDPNAEQTPEQYAHLLARDIRYIAEGVGGVVVLPGWEESGGAKAEVAFARAIKLPILSYPDLREVAA